MHSEERNYGCRVSTEWTYRGIDAAILENESIRVVVLTGKGADIISFLHKPSDTEFMWKTPWGIRNPAALPSPTGHHSSVWLDYYEGGWQTVLPHGGHWDGKPIKEAEFGLHGDMNIIPWDCNVVVNSSERVAISFTASSMRSPVYVEKTLSITSNSMLLTLEEKVFNRGEEALDAVWLEHITLGAPFLQGGCRLYVPLETIILNHPSDTAKSSILLPGGENSWPFAKGKDRQVDFRTIPSKEERSLDMAYLTGMNSGWYAVVNEERKIGWLATWPENLFKYLWYWRNYGGGWGYPWYGRCYNAGLEPCTSYHNGGVRQATENGTALSIAPGAMVQATLRAGPFAPTGDVKRIHSDGTVVYKSF